MANVRITSNDLSRFTEGDCDVLAHELHNLTGWPIYSLHSGDRDHAMHAFVVAPGRIAVDVRGARSVGKMVREWRAEGYVRGCWSYNPKDAYPGSRRRARQIAPHLAALVDNG